ncbi:MAG: hypothetical protein ACREUG_06260 [Steroidobacteraceae bacterium]
MGASSGSAAAQNAANQQEAQRQAQTAAATQRINSIFSSPQRQQQYGQLGNSMMDYYTQQANQQKQIADRNQLFSEARSGLTGGSAAADAKNLTNYEYGQGMLQASQKAQSAVAGLEGQDQQTRAQLTQLAQNGLDSTSAASQAASAMDASIGNARSNAQAQGLGSIFGQTSQLYQQQQQAAAFRKQMTTPIGGLYGGYSGSMSPYGGAMGGMGASPFGG